MKVLLVLLLFVSFSRADIQNFLNNSVIELENPGSLSTDSANVYFGGGFRLRTPTVTFTPFQVVMPSVKAGCGGIDISFGAFSYFNTDQLVAFLKAVADQAPAMFFMTAVRTLCPQCEELQTKLTSLANTINSMNFDSCSIAQSIAGPDGQFIGKKINEALGEGVSGPDWLTTFKDATGNAEKFINKKVKNLFISKGCNINSKGCYAHFMNSGKKSLLAYALEDNPYFKSDTAFQAVLRAAIGDIYKLGDTGLESLKYKYIPPRDGSEKEKALLALMGLNDGICQKSVGFPLGVNEDGTTPYLVNVRTLCGYITDNLRTIIDKILFREELTDEELKFLSMFRIPVYRILNTLSLTPEILDKGEVGFALAKILSYELLYQILSAVSSDIKKVVFTVAEASKDKNIPIKIDDLKRINEDLSALLREAHGKSSNYLNDFRQKLQDYKAIEELRTLLMASLSRHPIMDSRIFSQSLLGFGF